LHDNHLKEQYQLIFNTEYYDINCILIMLYVLKIFSRTKIRSIQYHKDYMYIDLFRSRQYGIIVTLI